MDALLNNADVDQIWCECMDLTLVDDARPHRDILEPSKQPYAVLTLTDGTHVDEALAFPAANLAGGVAGQRVRARKHRVQWTNGKRQWFIFEGSLGEVGRAPAARALRPAPRPAAVPPRGAAPPKKKKRKRAADAGTEPPGAGAPAPAPPPFILGPGVVSAPAPAPRPAAASDTPAPAPAAAAPHPFLLPL